MYTTENDKFRFVLLGSKLRELERVTTHVGKLNNLVSLVMVAENYDFTT